MVDYRKFDHIGSDSEDEDVDPVIKREEQRQLQQLRAQLHNPVTAPESASTAAEASNSSLPPAPTVRAIQSSTHKNRFRFEHNGRLVYEWEQTLTEAIIYIPTPSGIIKKNQMEVVISAHHVIVALRGASQRYLDEDTGGPIVVDESTWFLEDNDDYKRGEPSSSMIGEKVLVVNLQKMHKAQTWTCALKGAAAGSQQSAKSELDAVSHDEVRKQMMRERFQEEHPGFDFSDADFNGQVPDAREFMGGVRYG